MNSNRTKHVATFRFSDSDISEIDRLKAEGFQFATVTMRDKRGYERAFTIWVPSGFDIDGHKIENVAKAKVIIETHLRI